LLHPDATPRQLAATATAGLTTLLLSALCARRWFPVTLASPPGRRPVAILLLGSSLAALIWSDSPIPLLLTLAVITGFIARWSLFALEVRDIRISDELRIGLPTLATRTRLIITWLTGALIPALVLLGIWTKPLLISAFLLTFFNQWTATCEGILARNHEKNRL